MACESCKVFVRDSCEALDINVVTVDLGEIITKGDVSDEQKLKLNSIIKEVGLELLEKNNGILIERIRAVIVDYVYNSDQKPNVNFSTLLSDELDLNYTYLSNFFSELEATTIEQYIIALKIERIKELILFEEFTFSEIAFKLHYSSVAHLSTQFKKVTGLSPTHFKALKVKRRLTIQNV